MKNVLIPAVALSILSCSTASLAATHRNAHPVALHMDKTRPCVFFYLTGVAQPDPAVPAAEAFAVSRSHPAFAELVAMLLTARAAGLKLGVFTTGSTVCGQAEVDVMILEGSAV